MNGGVFFFQKIIVSFKTLYLKNMFFQRLTELTTLKEGGEGKKILTPKHHLLTESVYWRGRTRSPNRPGRAEQSISSSS